MTLTGVTGDAEITLDDAPKTASLDIADNDSATVSISGDAERGGRRADLAFTVTLERGQQHGHDGQLQLRRRGDGRQRLHDTTTRA